MSAATSRPVPAIQAAAVAAFVKQGLSAIAAREAGLVDQADFHASAIATAAARAAGISAPLLGKAYAAASTAWKAKAVDNTLYTSPEAVGYHAATGRLFSLAGDAGMLPRDAQSVVRTTRDAIGAAMVDEMIKNGTDQADVLAALAGKRDKRLAEKKAEKKAEEKKAAEEKAATEAALAAAEAALAEAAEAAEAAESHADQADQADAAGTPDRTVADAIQAESGDVLAEAIERALALVDAGAEWSPRAITAMLALAGAQAEALGAIPALVG